MKILLLSPWENRWIGYMRKYFEARGHKLQWSDSPRPIAFLRWADIVIFGWANEQAENICEIEDKFSPYICFIRSYEIFEQCIAKKIDWDKIDAQIFVNPSFREIAKRQGIPVKPAERCWYIPNAIDVNEWPLQEHSKGDKIAVVADLSFKKGLQLLAQVFLALPERYELHLAGRSYPDSSREIISFNHILKSKGASDRVFIDGYISDIKIWLRDKSYILSTSPIEGCPNNILEAMSCGIKPVVYNWPGAKEMFSSFVFDTISQAVDMILRDDYDSKGYRDYLKGYAPNLLYGGLEKLISQVVGKKSQEICQST